MSTGFSDPAQLDVDKLEKQADPHVTEAIDDMPEADHDAPARRLPARFGAVIGNILKPLASLKLTVWLFAASIFLVFAGTLVQVDKGIWTVVDEYFRCFVVYIDLQIFFPRAWGVPGWFPFPGGWTIGTLLLVNILAAHIVRFTIKASGQRLMVGLGVLAVGLVLTWMALAGFFTQEVAATEGAAFWRVLWRLIQGGIGAVVLLVACWILFYKRAGIVLLHGGIILLLFGELITGLWAVETNMTIVEGETVNFVDHSLDTELAVIETAGDDERVVVVPESKLRRSASSDAKITHEELPFDVKVVEYMDNSTQPRPVNGLQMQRDQLAQQLESLKGESDVDQVRIENVQRQIDQIDSTLAHDNPATAGIGTRLVLSGREEGSGVSMDQGKDMEAAYVTFYEKGSDKPIDTYLLALWFDSNTTRRQLNEAQKITVGDKQYTLYLRPERHYKPYSLHLIDFRHEVYPGTQKPKDFSSHVRIIDKEKNVDRTVRIWMNNPLRYRGETFYQSSFLANDSGTVLQVVKNVGWMIPYVSCMIVAAGMSLHFCMGLYGFLRKRAKAS